MAHSLICGMTESGKTTLAKYLAGEYKRTGVGVLVLDAINDPGWNADFQTTDQDHFMQVFFDSRGCAAFLDESGDVDFSGEARLSATQGRHYGHSCHFITQRQANVNKTVRDQCRYLFCFALSYDDRVILSKDFNAPVLKDCGNLQPGEFIKCDKFGNFERKRIF